MRPRAHTPHADLDELTADICRRGADELNCGVLHSSPGGFLNAS